MDAYIVSIDERMNWYPDLEKYLIGHGCLVGNRALSRRRQFLVKAEKEWASVFSMNITMRNGGNRMIEAIRLTGVRIHNMENISVSVPGNRIGDTYVSVTGRYLKSVFQTDKGPGSGMVEVTHG